jgi:hypothetical protein
MTHYYLDASALVKLYLPESGSRRLTDLLRLTQSLEPCFSSELVVVEALSALARARREGRISRQTLEVLRARLMADAQTFPEMLTVSRDIVEWAGELTMAYPLRAYDAVHLATALDMARRFKMMDLPAPIFVSADETLLAAAQSEGLRAENPNDHP